MKKIETYMQFQNLNVDSEVKVKVTRVKFVACMECSCPNACVCHILKVQLYWFGSYEQLFKILAIFGPRGYDRTNLVDIPNIKALGFVVAE